MANAETLRRQRGLEGALALAYSPCPNDTFIFSAIASGAIDTGALRFDIQHHDVETLNERLRAGVFDVSKVSFHAYLESAESYTLLDAGAAVGFGCGPLIVARSPDALDRPESAKIAVPGKWTTANLLLRLWEPTAIHRMYMPYDRVMAAVLEGRADAGVIIHESRFVYRDAGLAAIVDLGAWWEQETTLPLPLGGIVAKRSLGRMVHQELESLIRRSINFAREHPERAAPYVRAHAQEMSSDVIDQHIATFVNDFSLQLGQKGHAAIDRLSTMARSLKGVPA